MSYIQFLLLLLLLLLLPQVESSDGEMLDKTSTEIVAPKKRLMGRQIKENMENQENNSTVKKELVEMVIFNNEPVQEINAGEDPLNHVGTNVKSEDLEKPVDSEAMPTTDMTKNYSNFNLYLGSVVGLLAWYFQYLLPNWANTPSVHISCLVLALLGLHALNELPRLDFIMPRFLKAGSYFIGCLLMIFRLHDIIQHSTMLVSSWADGSNYAKGKEGEYLNGLTFIIIAGFFHAIAITVLLCGTFTRNASLLKIFIFYHMSRSLLKTFYLISFVDFLLDTAILFFINQYRKQVSNQGQPQENFQNYMFY